MANDGSSKPPVLAAWAEVDPARYPFDAVEAQVMVRRIVPSPPPRPLWRDGGWVGDSEAWAWVDAVGVALSDRYGPWAYRWYWGPGESERLGWITDRIPRPAEAPAFVADSLLAWRRWLDNVAERFVQFLRQLDPTPAAKPDDTVAGWEAAIANLMTTAVALTVDDDRWQGWCRRVLQWLLTATGVPVQRAEALVNGAVDKRFDPWVRLTAADISDVSERLTRALLSPSGIIPAAGSFNWPDTWPHSWPLWRATNTGRAPG
jgi:hypothetical protein